MACFCPDLSKDQAVFMSANDVNLAFGAAVVDLKNTEAPFFKEIAG